MIASSVRSLLTNVEKTFSKYIVYPIFSLRVDVDDVKFVINFDYPHCSEDYIHRIGRTGRSQRTGTAYTFFTPDNSKQAQDLVGVLREAKQAINPKLYELASSNRGGGGKIITSLVERL